MEPEVQHKRLWIRPEISIGDILMAVGFAIGGLSSFFILSERVAVNYAEFQAHKQAQEKQNETQSQEMREARAQAQVFRQEIIVQLQTLNNNVVLLRERVAQNEVRNHTSRQ